MRTLDWLQRLPEILFRFNDRQTAWYIRQLRNALDVDMNAGFLAYIGPFGLVALVLTVWLVIRARRRDVSKWTAEQARGTAILAGVTLLLSICWGLLWLRPGFLFDLSDTMTPYSVLVFVVAIIDLAWLQQSLNRLRDLRRGTEPPESEAREPARADAAAASSLSEDDLRHVLERLQREQERPDGGNTFADHRDTTSKY